MRALSVTAATLALLAAATGCSRRGRSGHEPPATRDGGRLGPSGAPRAGPAAPEADLPPRRFVLVEGPVTLDGKAATTGEAIGPGAVVVTSAAGRAVLALGNGTFVEVRPGSRVTLGSSVRKRLSLSLATGALWSVVAAGASYEVVTPSAIAVARGTRFFVEHGKGRTYVCACEGRVEVLAGGPKALPRNLDAGRGHAGEVVDRRGRAGRSAHARRHGHTDAEEAALRALVARIPAGPAEIGAQAGTVAAGEP